MRIRPPNAPGIVLTAMLSFSAAVCAQQPLGPTPHTPDLLGIYPGMPLNEARAQLQKHSADVYVQDNLPQGFGLTIPDPENPDSVTVFVTRAPNDPATVWKITRSGGGAMTVDSGVVAFMNHAPGQELFRGYEVTLINLPYAVKASLVTANAKNGAAKQAQQEEMRKAGHNAPTF